MQRITTEMINVLLIRAAFKQSFHQGDIACRRSCHQGRLVHLQTMFYPVAGTLVQNFLEVLGKISRVALPALASALLGSIAIDDFVLVNDRASQEARFFVIVIDDYFQHEGADVVIVPEEAKD